MLLIDVIGREGFNEIIVRADPSTADWYRVLLANSADATALLAPDGTVLFVTASIERLTGFTPQEVVGAKAFDLVHPDDLPRVRAALGRAVEQAEPVHIAYRARHKDGSWRHGDVVAVNRLGDPSLAAVIVNYRDTSPGSVAEAAAGDAISVIAGASGVPTDVTENVQVEQRLMQTHKMEAIGRLAGSIAHDFNNYLTAIVGYAELALAQVCADDPLRQDLVEIRKAGRSAASLTRQLLAFSRKQLLQFQVIDLNTIVRRITGMLHRLIREDIEVRWQLTDPLDRVCADPGQIEQVVMNLALNARDAMPTGGVLTIETANIQLDERFVAEHPGSSTGHHVMLAVSDTGTGIDREVQERLFEPFHTTKASGRGTGLGLATVYGIVKQSGGSIYVHSELHRGTSFTIYLPRVDRSVDVVVQPPDSFGDLTGHETVLVVEDQPEVRSVVQEALARCGYRVLMATSGSEALDISSRHGGPIDVLVTDVVMPGLSARELAERFRHQHPAGRVLYMSGHTDETVVQRGIIDQNVDFIEKPFAPATLLRRIRGVLNATGPDSGE